MRNILITLLFFGLTHTSQAQQHIISSVRLSATNDRDFIHDVANDFTESLGKALKVQYPSKIKKIDIKIDATKDLISLYYTADIEKCDTASADYIIEHAGALSIDFIKNNSANNANKRSKNQATNRYKIMSSVYGKQKVRLLRKNYISSIFYHQKWWSVCERFVISKK